MSRLLLVIFFAVLSLVSSATVYKANLTCGTCVTKTGCTGNTCLFLTGDVKGEYCYGSGTCGFNSAQAIKLGLCSNDATGQSCSSGLCLADLPSNFCYPLANSSSTCPNGVTFYAACLASTVSYAYSYPSSLLPVSNTTTLSYSCPWSTVNGSFSTCSSDIYGGSSCSCCAQMTFTGMTNVIGNCVPSSSPLVAIKSSLGGQMVALISGTMLLMLMAVLF